MTLEADAAPVREKRAPWFMRGNFAPVADEIDAFDLTVEGAIPEALDGVYLRNGANPAKGVPVHWFAGDGMLHGLRLRDGKALWYRNRWVRTKALAGAKTMRDDFSMDRSVGVANTHVVPHAGRIYALVESSFPHVVTPELETVGPHDFGGRLDYSFTAHPKVDPETGEMHAFGYGFGPPFLVYHVIDARGDYVRREEIPMGGPTMVHDFAMTKDHVIFMDLPVCFDLDVAMKGGMPYVFRDDYPARLGILRKGAAVETLRWVAVDPCYVFHVANAFEQDGSIVIDVARYAELWRPGTTKNFDPSYLHRWTIRPGATKAEETPLDDRNVEFPRTDERRVGRPYRYAYAAMGEGKREVENFSVLARYDLETGGSLTRAFGSRDLISEFVAAPKGPDAAEDQQWLMGFVYDDARGSSDFLILDAATLETQARVALPRRVPQGFHGSWCPGY